MSSAWPLEAPNEAIEQRDSKTHRGRPDEEAGELRRRLAATELRLRAALRHIDRIASPEGLVRSELATAREAALRAQRFAYHDELTGLPNRYLLLDRFNLAVASAERHDQQPALLFLDLDGFKHVNDTLGHRGGDELLRQVAARLLASLRAADTACRYGGDEFVVLLPELGGREGAAVVAAHIATELAAPYLLDGATITITASVGIAMHRADAHCYRELLRVADLAMYRDKARRSDLPGIVLAPTAALLAK
jgi:diguanylate cyclase (GGDEF)-like protein